MKALSSACCFLLLACSFSPPGRAAAAVGPWEERFARPPADARILKIIHGWPDAPEQQDGLIRRLQDQGFGGVVCNVSFDQYLESESHWRAFVRAVEAARQAGFALWLYDERGYPSGNAGGLVLRDHPEWEARGLLVADQAVAGGSVNLELPPGKLVLAAAYPVEAGQLNLSAGTNLAARVADGRLAWTAPEGRWHVVAITDDRLYKGTHAEGNYHAKIPYPNLLMPEPTAKFLDLTYGGYAAHLGKNLGRYFEATFTDEPSLMSLFLQPMPYRPLPWAPDLPAEFQRRRGRALELPLLPALAFDAGPATAKFRYDFWLTIGELVSENYFGQIQTRTRELGMPSGGHLLAEEGLVGHVPLYGDFFRCIRRLDAPSIDCLTSVPSEVPWFIARLLASAAELEGRTLVMSETSDHGQVYRPAGDSRPKRIVTEAEVRGTCNREIVAGVNTITSYYSFEGLTDETLRRLNDWIGRCCTAVRGGQQVADIALLYPVESIWPKFTPSRHWTRECAAAARVENVYRATAESLFANQRDFTFLDSRGLTESRAENGTLVHGGLRWSVVILPAVDTLPLAAWEQLARFVREGGVAIALAALPANSENEFPSGRVQALATELFGVRDPGAGLANEPRFQTNAAGGAGIFLPRGLEGLVPAVLDGILARDVAVTPAGSPLRVTHRRIEGREVYFVINDSGQPWSGSLDFAAAGVGERWDPATGRRAAEATAQGNALSLELFGAAFYRFASADAASRRRAGSALPGLVRRHLAVSEPTVARGEFVRAELIPDPSHSRPDAPAWESSAVLTRGQVDTFLFLNFHFAKPIDLGDANCLVVDSWVPEGQATPSQLLFILHEEGGGDFLAETGRSLAQAGRETSFVPLSRFQLTSWTKDADGVLDPKRISDIRVGWGGYLGAEGEKVRFSTALPQVGSIRSLPAGAASR